jgi:hypothetical protein
MKKRKNMMSAAKRLKISLKSSQKRKPKELSFLKSVARK